MSDTLHERTVTLLQSLRHSFLTGCAYEETALVQHTLNCVCRCAEWDRTKAAAAVTSGSTEPAVESHGGSPPLSCPDCGLLYRDEGWADFCVSDEMWAKLTQADDAEVLCFNCMNRRAVRLGLTGEGHIKSGPFCFEWDAPAPAGTVGAGEPLASHLCATGEKIQPYPMVLCSICLPQSEPPVEVRREHLLQLKAERDALRARLAAAEGERDTLRNQLSVTTGLMVTCKGQADEAREAIRAALGLVSIAYPTDVDAALRACLPETAAQDTQESGGQPGQPRGRS